MRWILIVAVLVAPLAVPVAAPGTAHACSCAYAPDGPRILDHVSHASGVFTGTATAQRIDGDTAYYEFDVREVFAGEIGASTVVATSTQGPSCGTGYAIGTEYLVFASTSRSHGAPWSDNSCSATTASILSVGYIFPGCAANGAMPIHCSSTLRRPICCGRSRRLPPSGGNIDLNSSRTG